MSIVAIIGAGALGGALAHSLAGRNRVDEVRLIDPEGRIAGVPPRDAVIAWSAATAFRQPIAAVLAAHQQAAITSRLPALWPPSPYSLASAAARIAESLANGSSRRYTCFASLDGKGRRGAIAAVPVQSARGGIERTLDPALSPHERTVFENGFGYAS